MRSLKELEKDLIETEDDLRILYERNKGSYILSNEFNTVLHKIERLKININQRKQKDRIETLKRKGNNL